ncbi:hypothetical protein [Streptomyces sp. NBRC 110028]|uniref:hypothetical protein n=1 Tax=Streptomyces sp. NBRC 110028 TaxID=1621260 RepID=UPI000A893DC9|nr:hypothetical protein [Streptomyces sp. NBRC 110028]
MRKLKLGSRPARSAAALAVGILMVTGLSATSAGAASSSAGAAPELGVRFYPDGNGQCDGPTNPPERWVGAADWTTPIRLDTDNRAGGCQLAFGLYDPSNSLAGLTATYTWEAEPGSDDTQCQNGGTKTIPIKPFKTFGDPIRVDTDGRAGWCNLTFTLAGRSDIVLDVQWYGDGGYDASDQCKNYRPTGTWQTVYEGNSVTVGDDTDGRAGGCYLSLRLNRQF